MYAKLLFITILITPIYSSGGYDIGTANGKGVFKLDLTWNPFDLIDFGQNYFVLSYGITNKFDIHGYFSSNKDNYRTYYLGLFYQFYKNEKLDLATSFGIRRNLNSNKSQLFAPQLLYTYRLNSKFSLGGSFVNIIDKNKKYNDVSLDLGLYYKLNYESKYVENISIGISAFHPITWTPSTGDYFVPTYSVDISFK